MTGLGARSNHGPCPVVPHCTLEDHNLQGLLHPDMAKPTAVDKCGYPGVEGVDACIGALAHILEELIY